jgi:hypothetical protein
MPEKTTLKMKPGRYFAGINRPWYASQSAVRAEVEKRLGLTDVRFFARKVAPPINPRIDPRYADGWDEWISARYDGPERLVSTDRLWQWVVRSSSAEPPPASSGATAQGADTADGSPGGWVVLGGLGALVFSVWYARR